MSKHKFMNEVLGPVGFEALKRAGKLMPQLDNAILPRCAIAWVDASQEGFQGNVPGTSVMLTFKKSEDGYNGTMRYKGFDFDFKNTTEHYVVACVVTALGESKEIVEEARSIDLARLGKSVDLMVKQEKKMAQAKAANKSLQSLIKAAKMAHHGGAEGSAGTGLAQAPLEPTAPTPPTGTAPAVQAKQLPKKSLIPTVKPAKPKASYTLKLSEKEASAKCPVCSQTQLKAGKLQGCMCFRELVKNTSYTKDGDTYTVTLGPAWGTDEVSVFLETVRNTNGR